MNGRLKKMGTHEPQANQNNTTAASTPAETSIKKSPLKLARRQEDTQTFEHAGHCTQCDNDVPQGNVICLNCGFNLQTGESLKSAKKRIKKKTRAQSKHSNSNSIKSKVLWITLSIVIYFIWTLRDPIISTFQSDKQAIAALPSMKKARQGFKTSLTRKVQFKTGLEKPPKKILQLIQYPSQVGNLAAYVSPKPLTQKKYPAIIWIFGGFDNSIGSTAWQIQPKTNDQSASNFRKTGVVMMYPSLRGGNNNPGFAEGLYGEVDDIIAAYDYLSKLDYVDSKHIYLGGHSTGGTLALLVAENTDKFRAVFSLGPVGRAGRYGTEDFFFDTSNNKEWALRSPALFLNSINTPTFVFEGLTGQNNMDEFQYMLSNNSNTQLNFHAIAKHDHFSLIAPLTQLLAKKIVATHKTDGSINLSEQELLLQ